MRFHLARAKHLGVPPEKTIVFGDVLMPSEPMRARLALRLLVLDADRRHRVSALCGLFEISFVVGRGGLEPPTSAVRGPERCA